MSEVQIPLKQQVINYLIGKYNSPDVLTQINAGWYDWFCSDSSLKNKTDKLYKKVINLLENGLAKKIDVDKTYVFFKNNCPMSAPLYDSFSICDIETGKVLYWCSPKSTHSNKAELYGEGSFEKPLAQGSWSDIKNYFKSI